MKCPICDGKKTILVGRWNDIRTTCDKCHGTGEIEATNEEWFNYLSTKEKAEWLFKLTYKCYWCGREYTPRSLSLYNEKECPFKKCMKDKKDFEMWLKQPHTEKE